jgi:hypothetical protein
VAIFDLLRECILTNLRCIWVAAYSSSAGPLGFAFLADCSTAVLRAKTANMGALAFAVLSLITTYCTPIMLASPSFGVSGTFFFYGATSLVFVIIMWFVIPETKNRSYVELDEMFELHVRLVNLLPMRRRLIGH